MKLIIAALNLIGFVILLFFCLVAVGLLSRLTSIVLYFSVHSIKIKCTVLAYYQWSSVGEGARNPAKPMGGGRWALRIGHHKKIIRAP